MFTNSINAHQRQFLRSLFNSCTGLTRFLTRWFLPVLLVGITNSVHAVTWTAGEIVHAIQDAKANGQPFDKLLAQKISEEMAKNGLTIIDNNLVYKSVIPSNYNNLQDLASGQINKEGAKFVDYVVASAIVGPGFGACNLPIPAATAIAVRSDPTNLSVQLSNTGTYLDLRTNPNQALLKFGVQAEVSAHSKVGLEWCGVVDWPYACASYVKNPLCPPPLCLPSVCYKRVFGANIPYPCIKCTTVACSLPDVCAVPVPDPKRVQESWTDWSPVDITGGLTGSVTLALNHSLMLSNNTITIDARASLSGEASKLPLALLGPAVPDTRLISIPVPPFLIPHVDTSPAMTVISHDIDGALLFMNVVNGEFSDTAQFNRDIFSKILKSQEAKLNESLANYFPLQIQLPNIQDFNNLDPASQELVKFVLGYLRDHFDIVGEYVIDVVKNNWTQILYYIMTDNKDGLVQFFSSQAICPSVAMLKTDMPVMPLYSTRGGACAAIDPKTTTLGPYYADSSCQSEIGFQPENFTKFCQESLITIPNPILGNAAAWPSLNIGTDSFSTLPYPTTNWSLSSAAQLSVGVEPIKQNHIPYVKRINFRQANNCSLEMRVFTKDINGKNLKPLLWIHGGAWAYRSSGYLGMESLVSNYTEDDFVVFAPFYRLAGDNDGSEECRNATWQEMVSDVEAALEWVKQNGASFGASNSQTVAVTGQSAGAHLAGYLMTHHPLDISRGMLVYPPTDLHDFLDRLRGNNGASFPPLSDAANTPYNPALAQELLETFLQLNTGETMTVDLSSSLVTENSYPDFVRLAPQTFPPAFILHGTRDSLVTYSQSEVLCLAYGGTVNLNWSATSDLRAVFPCGVNSQLHLFKEADHAFEICPDPNTPSTCRAGSAASAALLTDSLQKGRQWLGNTH